MHDPSAALADFVTYVQTHLSGDEKGEAGDSGRDGPIHTANRI